MKTRLAYLFIFVAGCFFASGNAWANFTATEYDFGDAPGYDPAYHSNPSWQRLGTLWDNEATSLTPNNDDSDDGVSWSVDGGSTYGHEDILAGQTVEFKFDIYKKEWGRHATEQLAVWLDYNQDEDFIDAGERILTESWDFRTGPNDLIGDYDTNDNIERTNVPGEITLNDDYYHKSFFLELIFPETALGNYWLRARVACNFDVNPVENFMPTGHVWQGEVEDWMLTVNPVPEPSTFLLLGGGLVGLVFYARRRKNG